MSWENLTRCVLEAFTSAQAGHSILVAEWVDEWLQRRADAAAIRTARWKASNTYHVRAKNRQYARAHYEQNREAYKAKNRAAYLRRKGNGQ